MTKDTSIERRPGRTRHHAETRLLYRITAEVHDRAQPFERRLTRAVEHIAVYGYERATIALRDPATGAVRFEVSHGSSAEELAEGGTGRDAVIFDEVLRGGTAKVIASIAEDPRFQHHMSVEGEARVAFICVPIITISRETVGTLSVEVPDADAYDLDWERRLLSVIAHIIGEAVRFRREQREDAVSRSGVGRPRMPANFVGRSTGMREVATLMQQVSRSDLTVLIRGESGTGKELVARGVHAAGERARAPFVSVNCGALPEQLVESELFGHVRGAFTGATNDRRGRFELANGGTLFLDEIGDLPPPMQVKLLRVLQEGEIQRVGDERVRRIDVRVIAATHTDLETAITAGRFREDLFYRLNVFPIFVPPLRERRTDITLLVDHFIEKHARAQRRPVTRISTPAIDMLCAYHWPGNVRELENCVERAVLLAHDGVIRDHHLPPTLQTGASSGTSKQGSLESMMMAYEREILIEAMKDARGNMSKAARALEATPRIIAYKLRAHGLHEVLAMRRRD